MTTSTGRIDQFLLLHAARADKWRELISLAGEWARGKGDRKAVEAAVAAMAPLEEFHAYPGARLLAALNERVAGGDAAGVATLARRISNALLTRAYRERPGEWDLHDEMPAGEVVDVLPPALGERETHRPYFEVLFVVAQPASRWPALAAEIRRLRRPEDAFVYEAVIVGSFEDAFCAAAMKMSIAL